MINIAICDDENTICTMIEDIVEQYSKNNSIDIDIEVFWNGDDLIEFIEKEHKFDLIFLDIEIGETTGIDVSQKIRNEFNDYISKIVFISAVEGYEKSLFEVHPLNFIYKPIDERKLIKCIDITKNLLNISSKKFEYKVKQTIKSVSVDDIIYFENHLRKIKVVTNTSEDFFYDKLVNILEKLPDWFISPHSSYVINYNYIDKIIDEKVIMTNGLSIPISRKNIKIIHHMQIKMEKELNHNAL